MSLKKLLACLPKSERLAIYESIGIVFFGIVALFTNWVFEISFRSPFQATSFREWVDLTYDITEATSYRAYHWDKDDDNLRESKVVLKQYARSNKLVGTLTPEGHSIDKGPYSLVGFKVGRVIVLAGKGSRSGDSPTSDSPEGLGTIVLKGTQEGVDGLPILAYAGYIIDERALKTNDGEKLMKCPFELVPESGATNLDINRRDDFLNKVSYLKNNKSCEDFVIPSAAAATAPDTSPTVKP